MNEKKHERFLKVAGHRMDLLVGLSGGWEQHISVVSMPFPDIESHQIFQLPIIQTPDKILSGESKMWYF